MEIKAVAIHEVIKKAGKTKATMFLAKELVDVAMPQVVNIVTKLDNSFSQKTVRRAKFSTNGFKEEVKDFSKYDLLNVSKSLTRKLKDGIQAVAAKGGYLVFAEIKHQDDFLAVFLVRDIDGIKLLPSVKGTWDFDSTISLDLSNLAMGVKINLTLLNSKTTDRYISLVKGNTDISQYFENWVGIDDTKQENMDASALYDIANSIDIPEGMTRDELKKKIFEYAKAQPKRLVNLRRLSEFLYEDETTIPKYCVDNRIDIDGEFKLTGKNLEKFFKVSVKAGQIELTAPRSKFNAKEIQVVKDKVVIHSAELATEILQNLGRKD